MLSRVLLRHFQTMRPINFAIYEIAFFKFNVRIQMMKNHAIIIDADSVDPCRANHPHITGLSTAKRIKSCLIQHNDALTILLEAINN